MENSNQLKEPVGIVVPDLDMKSCIVYISLSAIIFGVLVYMIMQFVLSIKQGMLRRKNFRFFFFYASLQLLLCTRILYCLTSKSTIDFNPVLYIVWSYLPPLFVCTNAIFFIDTLLNSVLDVLATKNNACYSLLRLIPYLVLGINWVVGIALLAKIILEHYYNVTTEYWTLIFYYVSAGIITILGLALIILTYFLMKILQRFYHVFREKRRILLTVLFITIIQMITKVVHLIIAGTILNPWERKCQNDGDPGHSLYTAAYFLVSDVVPALVYTFYLQREISNQNQIERLSSSDNSRHESMMAKLEEIFTKRLSKDSLLQSPDSSFHDSTGINYKD